MLISFTAVVTTSHQSSLLYNCTGVEVSGRRKSCWICVCLHPLCQVSRICDQQQSACSHDLKQDSAVLSSTDRPSETVWNCQPAALMALDSTVSLWNCLPVALVTLDSSLTVSNHMLKTTSLLKLLTSAKARPSVTVSNCLPAALLTLDSSLTVCSCLVYQQLC